MKNILIVLIFIARFALCQQHSTLGIDEAKNQLKQALGERVKTSMNFNRAIKDKQTAIALAEPILFKGYGKEQIISERPYEIYLIDGYWVMNGTIPKKTLGGGFLIIIAAKDGRVIKLTHYK